jgi:UDP-N-acetylmuramate-alanine ligase
MIAFCLDRLGLDPAFLIGGDVPQLGGNARAGSGWLVVEGDESDRSVGACVRRSPSFSTSTSTTTRRSRRGGARRVLRGLAA